MFSRATECSHTTVETHPHELGKTWKYGVWIPYQLQHRVYTCMELMTSYHNYQWFWNLITGDERWLLCINCTHRRQWLSAGQTGAATPKTDPQLKKVMLSMWWGVQGIIHWELLPNGCTITADLQCQQLARLSQKLKGKQNRIYFLHDNARSHIANPTRVKRLKLGWVTVPHPPYSIDLVPTDYHLFRSLSSRLREEKFEDENDLKTDLANFFDQKSQDFYYGGILSLPERWRQVIDSNGA